MGKTDGSSSYAATRMLVTASAVALVISLGLCKAILGAINFPAAVIASLVAAVLGSGGEGAGDAIIFGVIVAGLCAIGLAFLPLAPSWAQVWLAFGASLVTSKLIWSSYAEFFHEPTESASALREYDIVRVVRLNRPDRPFCGNARRAPQLGDLATIVHEHSPQDRDGDVAAEMVDENGDTVWLADFEKSELALVKRP
jgi:hypothetical protein